MSLRIGIGAPYRLRVTVLATPEFDPMRVTGAVMRITKPNGMVATWTAEIAGQSSTSVQASYPFSVTGLDLDTIGTWRVWVQWTVPGETPGPRSEVTTFHVIAADK